MDNSTLNIIVKLQDDASAGLEEMASKISTVGDQISQTATSVGDKIGAMGSSMMSAGQKMQSTGQQLSIGLTLPIVALGTAVVETSMKFQSSMELIRTQAGASQEEVDKMTKAVLALAKSGQTGQGPQALADGLYHLESLGLRGSQAMDALATSAKAADLGLADMEGVTNALGAAIVTGIKGTENLDGAMGLLDATIGQGNMRMDDLVAALGTGILPAAKNFGLSLQDVGAALATLTDNGMRADESATRLRMTFSLLAAPTQKATDALAQIGLTQRTLADDMRSGGIVKAIEDLNSHLNQTQPAQEILQKGSKLSADRVAELTKEISNQTEKIRILQETQIKAVATVDAHGKAVKDLSDKTSAHTVAVDKHNLSLKQAQQELAKLQGELSGAGGQYKSLAAHTLDATEKAQLLSDAFGGGRSSAAILTLTQQVDRLKTKYDAIGASADTFNEKVEATHETNQFKLNAALAQMQVTLIDLGGTVMPLFAAGLQKLTTVMGVLVGWWDKLSPGVQKFIAIGLVLLAVLGPILVMIGSLITSIGAIMVVLGPLITFLGATAGAFLTLIVANPVILLVIAAVVALGIAAYELYKHWSSVVAMLKALWNGMVGLWNGIINYIADGILAFEKTWGDVWKGVGDTFKSAWDTMLSIVNTVIGAIQSAIDKIISSYNSMKSIVSAPVNFVSNAVSSVGSAIGNVVSSILPKHEAGGFVNAPRGTAVPIIAHGGEEIITAENVSSRRGGNTTIIIQNPIVRRSSDLDDMRKMVEQVLRPVLTNAKVIHI